MLPHIPSMSILWRICSRAPHASKTSQRCQIPAGPEIGHRSSNLFLAYGLAPTHPAVPWRHATSRNASPRLHGSFAECLRPIGPFTLSYHFLSSALGSFCASCFF